MKMKKEDKGITLIALVVTIIILLILAGVTIYFVLNGGLIGKVEEAVDKSNQAGQNEASTLDQAVAEVDKYLGEGEKEETIPEEDLIKIEYEFDQTTGTITAIKNKESYHINGGEYILPGGDTLVIPSQIDGVEVKSIASTVFENCVSIKRVIIPNTVTSIGVSCFSGCRNLAKATIPNSVTSMDKSFENCSGLTTITIPVTGYRCFAGCSNLKTVTLLNTTKSMTNYCFADCSNLTTITIPDSVTLINTGCFSGCTSLTTVNYTGSKEQWNAITKDDENDPLLSANIVYNYGK